MELLNFADDTIILIPEPTVDRLYYEANAILNDCVCTVFKNKLKLNLLKSIFICFNSPVNTFGVMRIIQQRV